MTRPMPRRPGTYDLGNGYRAHHESCRLPTIHLVSTRFPSPHNGTRPLPRVPPGHVTESQESVSRGQLGNTGNVLHGAWHGRPLHLAMGVAAANISGSQTYWIKSEDPETALPLINCSFWSSVPIPVKLHRSHVQVSFELVLKKV